MTSTSNSPTRPDRAARSRRSTPAGAAAPAGRPTLPVLSNLPNLSAVFDGLRARRGRARRIVARGVAQYDRGRILPRLVPATPGMIADRSAENGARIVATLERALRAERARGRAGHWTYSLDRHIGLTQALAAEKAALRARLGHTAAVGQRGATLLRPDAKGTPDSATSRNGGTRDNGTRDARGKPDVRGKRDA